MRFTEWVHPDADLGMVDPQGRLNALCRAGLPESLSGDRPIVQYSRHRPISCTLTASVAATA